MLAALTVRTALQARATSFCIMRWLQVEEIERLEAEVRTAQQSLTEAESAQATRKADRAAALAALHAANADAEAQLKEKEAATNLLLTEVKSLFRLIDYVFVRTGCGAVFDATAAATASGRPGSPLRTRSAVGSRPAAAAFTSPLKSRLPAMNMLASPMVHEEVRSGVALSSLTRFMGVIENRSVDVVQQYVALAEAAGEAATGLASPAVSPRQMSASPSTQNAALAAAASANSTSSGPGGSGGQSRSMSRRPSGAGLGGGRRSRSGSTTPTTAAAAAAAAAASAIVTPVAGVPSPAVAGGSPRPTAAAALGPANPTGRVRETLTSVAIVSALAMDPAKMEGDDGGTGAAAGNAGNAGTAVAAGSPGPMVFLDRDADDGSRPVPLSELKRQAMNQLAADKTLRAMRAAAGIAATVLTRSG